MAFDSPMYIVTTRVRGECAGCLAAFVTQCSIHPPRHLVCISVRNHTFDLVRDSPAIAVHTVPADRPDLASHFGSLTGDDVDKFRAVDWRPGPRGMPLLDGIGNWFVADVFAEFVVGDHHAFLVNEVSSTDDPAERALRYRDVMDLTPGHAA